MSNQNKLLSMIFAALLSSIGIIIPMFAPKIILEPASFTLASHVPVFIAMFLSPAVAGAVALITTFGFFISGYPIIVVLRALTHVIFALVGATILKKYGRTLSSVKTAALFALGISALHAVCEVAVVTFFYFGNGMTSAYYDKGYLLTVVGLVGIGTLIHSCIDFAIALFVWKPLQNVVTFPVSARISKNR